MKIVSSTRKHMMTRTAPTPRPGAQGVPSTVFVEGVGEFYSLAKAFAALDLPMAQHKKFRAALKADGTRTFGSYVFINNPL